MATAKKPKQKVECAYDEMVATGDLKPNPRNPNKHPKKQLELLSKIIKAQGWRAPITVSNRSGFIVRGHARLEAAKILGLTECPVDFQDYESDEAEMADMLADNRLAELAEPDMPMLKDILQDLDTGAFDMDLTGFDTESIESLMTQLHEPEEGLTEDDAIPEQVETICKKGDLWKLGEHRLLCGDSTVVTDVERLMGGAKADCIWTDPPYNALKSWHKDEAKSETRLNPNKWFKNDNMEWPEFKQFLLDAFQFFTGHSAYVCCDYRIYPLVVECLTVGEWDIKHCIVWKKNVWGLGKRYRFQHEFVVYACKGNAPFYGDRSQSDVWEVATDKGGEHNTPKPVHLTEIALNNSTLVGNVVLDMFLGSGSTLIACEKLGRKCYGMEIDEHYCDVIIKRWEDFTGKKAELINE